MSVGLAQARPNYDCRKSAAAMAYLAAAAPTPLKDIISLEKVQKRATKFISVNDYTSNYKHQ